MTNMLEQVDIELKLFIQSLEFMYPNMDLNSNEYYEIDYKNYFALIVPNNGLSFQYP